MLYALHVKGLISGIKDENTTYTVCSIVSAATVIHQLCRRRPDGLRLEALRKYLYHIDSMYCFVTLLPDSGFHRSFSQNIEHGRENLEANRYRIWTFVVET